MEQPSQNNYFCLPCKLRFDEREQLVEHWAGKRRNGQDHLHCAVCLVLFKFKVSLDKHNQQCHPKGQRLLCPGCDAFFGSAGALVSHIEMEECKVIRNQHMTERRENKLAFARELQNRHFGADPALTACCGDDAASVSGSVASGPFSPSVAASAAPSAAPSSVARTTTSQTTTVRLKTLRTTDFTRYLSHTPTASDVGTTASMNALRPVAENTVRPNPLTFMMQSSLDSPAASAAENDKSPDATGHPEKEMPNAETAQPKKSNVDEIGESVSQLSLAGARNPEQTGEANQTGQAGEIKLQYDPDDPLFNALDYYNGVLDKFKCPYKFCRKSFTSEAAFCTHLVSPQHRTGLRVTCPGCGKQFRSIASLTSHAESLSERCGIRYTEEFRAFLNQLTAGIVDTTSVYEDGTSVFEVSEDARRFFHPSQQPTKQDEERVNDEVDVKMNYWRSHEPSWD